MLDLSNIKRRAREAGFDLCGVTPFRRLAEGEERFRRWLEKGCQASLGYLERHTEKRFDPRLLLDGAQTAVVCAVGYRNAVSEGYAPGCRTKVASYACARDYHEVVREMLRKLLEALRRDCPGLRGRAFVDTAPLAEKLLAVEAGLGWIGRQSLLVTPRLGSFVVLGELLLCEPCDGYDSPFRGSRCGACRACVDRCPTGAILPEGGIDAGRCISCHTIEREPAARVDLDGWIFGCDACQSCCPYNRRAPMHRLEAFDMRFDPRGMDPAQWAALSGADFAERMGSTPLVRSGLERIRGNIAQPRPSEEPERELE